jgi:hypothetical protein
MRNRGQVRLTSGGDSCFSSWVLRFFRAGGGERGGGGLTSGGRGGQVVARVERIVEGGCDENGNFRSLKLLSTETHQLLPRQPRKLVSVDPTLVFSSPRPHLVRRRLDSWQHSCAISSSRLRKGKVGKRKWRLHYRQRAQQQNNDGEVLPEHQLGQAGSSPPQARPLPEIIVSVNQNGKTITKKPPEVSHQSSSGSLGNHSAHTVSLRARSPESRAQDKGPSKQPTTAPQAKKKQGFSPGQRRPPGQLQALPRPLPERAESKVRRADTPTSRTPQRTSKTNEMY